MLRQAAERAMEFRRTLDSRPQKPAKSFAEMRESFIAPLPEEGSDGRFVIEELAALAEPGLAAMTGPRFFGWVIGASHPVGVAADWLTSAWGQNVGSHTATPAAAACEEVGRQLAARSARPAARCVGRLRHRRDGRQLHLPRRRARRAAAPRRLGRRRQRPVRRAADPRHHRRGGACLGVLARCSSSASATSAWSASRPTTWAACASTNSNPP